MSEQRSRFFSRFDFPDLGRVVAAGRNQAAAIGKPGDGGDGVLVAVEVLVERAVLHVPDSDREVRALGPVDSHLLPAAATGQVAAVWRERDRPDDVLMLLPDANGAIFLLLQRLEQLRRPV